MTSTPHGPAEANGNPAATLVHGPEASVALRHLFLRPEDNNGPARARRLAELGIGGRQPIPEFDAFSRELASRLDAVLSGVNLLDDTGQYFAGLYAAPEPEGEASPPPDQGQGQDHGQDGDRAGDRDQDGDGEAASDDRALPPDLAFCPHVVARRKALVLEDIHDFARYSVDPICDILGVRSYLGAPLLDPSGIALGTAWVVDRQPRRWGRAGLAVIKDMATQLNERIQRGDFREPTGPIRRT